MIQAVVLAAGSGTRMRPLTEKTPKCLLDVDGQTFLGRLLHQLNEYPIDRVVVVTGYRAGEVAAATRGFEVPIDVVYNERYENDVNVYSMKLALQHLEQGGPVLLFEADVWLDDLAMRSIVEESGQGDSVWFTSGPFGPDLKGGILHAEPGTNRIDDIRIVPAYTAEYCDYRKILGVTTLGPRERDAFARWIDRYCEVSIGQYWLKPWIEHGDEFPARAHDLGHRLVRSVNTAEEFALLRAEIAALRAAHPARVELVPLDTLRSIEAHLPERAQALGRSMFADGTWRRAIIVERRDGLVLDGHHRVAMARQRGLARIPAVRIEYSECEVWSLRPEVRVTREEVRRRTLAGEIYPPKTAKHQFPLLELGCSIPLEDLQACG